MWNLEKSILVTNNDKVYEKYKDKLQCVFMKKYEDVLKNRKETSTFFVDNIKDILLIEKCLETFRQWQEIAKTPESYQEKVAEDFKTIDLSVIDNIIPRIY